MIRRALLLAGGLALAAGPAFATASTPVVVTIGASPPPAGNTITVSDASGAGETNYPMQFGRPFIDGAIPHAPMILVNGAPVPSQADVKTRYPDGSVEFAVVAAVLPSVPAGGSVTLSFVDTTANSNTPLTSAQMLGSNYDFDAVTSLAFPARITGPALAGKLATFQAITNGGFAITVNGTAYQVTGLNFSTATQFYPVAGVVSVTSLLKTAISSAGIPVIISPALTNNGSATVMEIQTSATGAGASLSYASAPSTGTDISAMLGWTSTTKFNDNLTGVSGSASARAMLAAGNCQPWTSGPIAQTMVCADDSAVAAYDIGNGDGFQPFRPRFEATFWPSGLNNVYKGFLNNLSVEGYPLYLLGGVAMLDDAGAPGAAAAWAWMKTNVENAATTIPTAPKWAIVPRTDANALPPIPTATPPG
ncbi:MAG: DUF3383 family protein [Candidatus Binataceae bacterium]|nr:DUF3383 family protein [Candidatus Binataceae bacterium]